MIRNISKLRLVTPLHARKCTYRYGIRFYSSSTGTDGHSDIKIATDDYECTNSFKTLATLKEHEQIPDHSIPHSYIMGSETYGQLVRDSQYDLDNSSEKGGKRVKVIEFEQHTKEYREEIMEEMEVENEEGGIMEMEEEISSEMKQEEDRLTGEEKRVAPEILQGRTNRRQIKIPDIITRTINNKILMFQDPKKLKIKASRLFVDLNETGIQKPSKDTSLEVDANIAALFVQNYGECYQVLYELIKRRPDFNPKRVLDVSYGPSTGMIALNEIMGDDFAPDLKHSFIIGSYEMQKRAKVLLSRQLCEYNKLDQDEIMTNEKIMLGEDLVHYDNGASHEIDTKKIKIKTKMLSYVPESIQYDLIILSHQLLTSTKKFPLEIDEVLDEYLKKLSPQGVIVMVERGSPLGFETIARARQVTMRPENHPGEVSKTVPRIYIKGSDKKPKNHMMTPDYFLKIVAPCSHHGECPLQLKKLEPYSFGGKLKNKIQWCHFNAKIQRPKFLMELKKGKYMGTGWDKDMFGIALNGSVTGRSGRAFAQDFETLSYSYLILERAALPAAEPETELTTEAQAQDPFPVSDITTWPRVMQTPLKRKGMVIAEVCNSSGKLEKWIIPKSLGKQVYHDARKLQQGDLWSPEGAKTKLPSSRNAATLLARIESKEANIRETEKLTKRQEKKNLRLAIEAKQAELNNMTPNEYNLEQRLDNVGLQAELNFSNDPKFQKLKKNKYKF